MVSRAQGGGKVAEGGTGLAAIRAEFRTKWRTAAMLAVLLGLGGGVALTAFAGASRTNQAMPQFLKYSLPDDGGFLVGSLSAPPATPGARAGSLALSPIEQRIVDLPQVAAYFRASPVYDERSYRAQPH